MSAWGKNDDTASKPKWLNMNDGNFNNANVYGVDTVEAGVFPASNSAGYQAAHSGWVKVIPKYTDSSGNVRKKSEVLVTLNKMRGTSNTRQLGAVTVSTLNVVVNGLSTNFQDTDIAVGDLIFTNGETKSIDVVNSPTSLNVNSAFTANSTANAWYLIQRADANNILSGNVSVFTLNANVLGVNTRFTTEMKVGDIFYVGPNSSNVRIVTSITSATLLTANAALASNGANQKLYLTDNGVFPNA